jgi:hypothetical protein
MFISHLLLKPDVMRCLYSALFLFFTTVLLHSQTLEVAPAGGNPVLKSFANKERFLQAEAVERLTGENPLFLAQSRELGECPPEFLGYLVSSGDSIEIELDTFGLTNGPDQPVLSILNAQELNYGTVKLDTGILLTYFSNPGFNGAGTDTVLVLFSQASRSDTISTVIYTKRKGKTVVANSLTVQPESVSSYCLDNEISFPRPKACSELMPCDLTYDGAGFPTFHFRSYAFPDTCIVYYACRFPGVDTVSIRICDEWAVCDTLKIPFIVTGDTLSISPNRPFFDDFSTWSGFYPSNKNWLDKNVYVNATMAKNPPSIGMATFDGLDSRGDVYDIISGAGDRLTSKAIDLSGYKANDLVSLRFFIAPKGYGLEPEAGDSLILEFRNSQRRWVRMHTFKGMSDVQLDSFPPFTIFGIQISDPQFLHKAFQFRLTAFTSPGGAVDLWHADYFYLGPSVNADNPNFNDVAFTLPPSSLLKNYTSMPWWHFKGHSDEELTDAFEAQFYNHFDFPVTLNKSGVNYRETTLGINFNQNFTIVESGENIFPKVPTLRQGAVPEQNFGQIKTVLNTQIPEAPFRNLETRFAFVNTSQSPADLFSVNDTIRLNTPFSNYFAHDDGTAEWQVFIKHSNGQGQHIASQFHANVPDTVHAVQLMFPHVIGNVQDQVFNLKIWVGSVATNPVFERQLLKPFYASNVFDTLQGFTTYVLDDFLGNPTPVFIPAGDFFVGIEQVTISTNGIPIGFDLQNPCDCNWFSQNGATWGKFPESVSGALLIRPVLKKTRETSTGTSEQAAIQPVDIFPNPTTGILRFYMKQGNPSDYKVFVFNGFGQQLMTQRTLQPELDLNNLNDGIYFIQLQNEKNGKAFSRRIVIVR